VGYLVHVPQGASYIDFVSGKRVQLYVYTHVREDALDLYGFKSRGEKELFLTLLGVSGVGPRVALGILSKVDPSSLIRAVIEGDKEELVQIPGIGKKTAERVVLELADPLKKKMEAGAFSGLGMTGSSMMGAKATRMAAGASSSRSVRDAQEALLGLGYREPQVAALFKDLAEEGIRMPSDPAEEWIRAALQRLG